MIIDLNVVLLLENPEEARAARDDLIAFIEEKGLRTIAREGSRYLMVMSPKKVKPRTPESREDCKTTVVDG